MSKQPMNEIDRRQSNELSSSGAVGINSHKEYAMAQYKAELMKKLELIYPNFQQNINLDGRITKHARSKIYPEPIRILRKQG